MYYVITYTLSVVVINCGFSYLPQWDAMWSAGAGLTFVLRDFVQLRYGHRALLVMLAAIALSYLSADPKVALASAMAFGVSEFIDWVVFSITQRPLKDRLWISSAMSTPVDTVVFFGMIEVWEPSVLLISLLSKLMGVSIVWFLLSTAAQPPR